MAETHDGGGEIGLPEVDEILYADPYDTQIGVLFDRGDYEAWVDLVLCEEVSAAVRAEARTLEHSDGSTCFVLFLPLDASASMMAHEAVHLAWYVLDHAGVAIDGDNHEAQAYLVDYLVQQMLGMVERYA